MRQGFIAIIVLSKLFKGWRLLEEEGPEFSPTAQRADREMK